MNKNIYKIIIINLCISCIFNKNTFAQKHIDVAIARFQQKKVNLVKYYNTCNIKKERTAVLDSINKLYFLADSIIKYYHNDKIQNITRLIHSYCRQETEIIFTDSTDFDIVPETFSEKWTLIMLTRNIAAFNATAISGQIFDTIEYVKKVFDSLNNIQKIPFIQSNFSNAQVEFMSEELNKFARTYGFYADVKHSYNPDSTFLAEEDINRLRNKFKHPVQVAYIERLDGELKKKKRGENYSNIFISK